MEESCSSTMDISILTDFLLATNCNLDDFLGGGVLRDCWIAAKDVSQTQHDANTYQSATQHEVTSVNLPFVSPCFTSSPFPCQ
jgi:hypothetical protein